MLTPFHLAVQVHDLAEARRFYGEVLGCPEGRSSDSWVDFNLLGHQFVCHLNPALGDKGIEDHRNPVSRPPCSSVIPVGTPSSSRPSVTWLASCSLPDTKESYFDDNGRE
jgi:extradiol dioxygenase family protein